MFPFIGGSLVTISGHELILQREQSLARLPQLPRSSCRKNLSMPATLVYRINYFRSSEIKEKA